MRVALCRRVFWLPQFDLVIFRVIDPRELAIWLFHSLIVDPHTCLAQFLHGEIKIVHPEVQHEWLVHTAEVISVRRKWREHRWTAFLHPGGAVSHRRDAKIIAVPTGQCLGRL